ncbi:hypothetical protein [Streptomyces sp. AS02]|uniref:hypothetical protein n=1 Tax=Streptomyces sp. AS02 TaxID=2938946 RepID=UPI0020227A0F|nr:hypothetical protein [Streptomyces sp. AS02]MCL8016197.1 hypothetical protein [Streptomyces sp. AS02]
MGVGGAAATADDVARITVPIELLVHANPGKHADVPAFELDSPLRADVLFAMLPDGTFYEPRPSAPVI